MSTQDLCPQFAWKAFCVVVLSAVALCGRAQQNNAASVQFVADGMCCQGCAQKIAAQLYTAPGVTKVDADLPTHTVTVTFRPSPKLKLETLWRAVEKADGRPSKFVTAQGTYTLVRPEYLQLSTQLPAGEYSVIAGRELSDSSASAVIKQLSAVRNVTSVNFDAANDTFFVQTAADPLSPWTVILAVEQCGLSMESITGPYGKFSVERPAPRSAQNDSTQQQQGAVR